MNIVILTRIGSPPEMLALFCIFCLTLSAVTCQLVADTPYKCSGIGEFAFILRSASSLLLATGIKCDEEQDGWQANCCPDLICKSGSSGATCQKKYSIYEANGNRVLIPNQGPYKCTTAGKSSKECAQKFFLDMRFFL